MAEERVETPRRRSWLARHRGRLALSLVLAGAFAYLLHAGALPLVPSKAAFEQVEWWTVPTYFAIWVGIHYLRAARWLFLIQPIHPVPLRRVIAVAFIGFAAIVMLPLRTGEVVRPMLIRRKGLSGWAAVGTVGAERVIDGLFLSLLLFVALQIATPLDPLPDHIGAWPVPVAWVPRAAYAALALFAAAFTVMGLFYWRRELARRLTERIVGIVSRRLADWLAERVEQVASGLGFLPRARYSVPFLAVTTLYWIGNVAALVMLARGCGFEAMTFSQSAVCVGVIALGILVPNAPGFFGAFQLSMYAGLAMYFPAELVVGPGAALVLLVYATQLGITIVAGGASMLLEHTSVDDALDDATFLAGTDER